MLLDLPDPGWGSPVGNSLDHGVGYSTGEMRDHIGSHCGMEVVLPNGELIRTGMGAAPNAKTWQDYRYGAGPYIDGMFSQSNFGVVTKMGFWLNPLPDAYLEGTVTVPKHQDLIPSGGHPKLPRKFRYYKWDAAVGQPDIWRSIRSS